MADLVFLLIIVSFFALCVAYIRGCDRIIGTGREHDAEIETELDDGTPTTPVGAPPVERAA
jgi:hypothetical protein